MHRPLQGRGYRAEGRVQDDAGLLSPAYLTGLYQRHQRLQSRDLRRPGCRDRCPLRRPTTRAEVNSGDVPERPIAVVDARPDGPARHLRDGVVDGCPDALPLVVCHRPRLRSRTRQTTNAAISTVTAMIARDQRTRRQFIAAALLQPVRARRPRLLIIAAAPVYT